MDLSQDGRITGRQPARFSHSTPSHQSPHHTSEGSFPAHRTRSNVREQASSRRNAHGDSQYGPLSIPIFTTPYTPPALDDDTQHSVDGNSHEDHFDYDEQVPENSHDSDDDSEGAFGRPELGVDSHNGPTSRYPGHSLIDESHSQPRRSTRERKVPVPFAVELPPQPQKPLRKPGRPPKSLQPKPRGRPRKYPLPGTSAVLSEASAPSSPSPNSSVDHQDLTEMHNSVSSDVSTVGGAHHFAPSVPTANSTESTPTARHPTAQSMEVQDMMEKPDASSKESLWDDTLDSTGVPLLHPFPALQHFIGPANKWFTPDLVPQATPSSPNSSLASGATAPSPPPPFSTSTPFDQLRFISQPSQVLDCKSGIMCMALSPCGTILACGTLLGQIYIFGAQPRDPNSTLARPLHTSDDPTSANALFGVPEWHDIKWVQLGVLQDFNPMFVDEFWCIAWTPDSSHILAAGACKSRYAYDEEESDLKVFPCPLVVFDLYPILNHTSSRENNAAQSKSTKGLGIRRYQGHQEEVVDLKMSILDTTRDGDPIYGVITCSQDGHVRKWTFDKTWSQLYSNTCLNDEDTWMAFSACIPLVPPLSDLEYQEEEPCPVSVSYPQLLVLAGDGTLKLFDTRTNSKIHTFPALYNTYCTNVELFSTPTAIEHPWKPGLFIRGDGLVFGDAECRTVLADEPPTFLLISRGIDRQAYTKKKKGANAGSDDEWDELEEDFDPQTMVRPGEPNPTRVLMHILVVPVEKVVLRHPATKTVPRRVDVSHKWNVVSDLVRLETLYSFAHPRFECNYWPGKLTHNGRYIVSVASNGAAFAWNLESPTQIAAAAQRTSTTSASPSSTALPPVSLLTSSSRASQQATTTAPHKTINASSHIAAILASHEELALRDICFHPYWPFIITAGDDTSVHVWTPTLFDPINMCSIPSTRSSSDGPIAASLTSVIVPQGASLASTQQISTSIASSSSSASNQTYSGSSVYKAAVEAAMMASIGSLLPAVAKRKRGRPPKKRIIEEIEAQFAAQERALAAQQQLSVVNPQNTSQSSNNESSTPTGNEMQID